MNRLSTAPAETRERPGTGICGLHLANKNRIFLLTAFPLRAILCIMLLHTDNLLEVMLAKLLHRQILPVTPLDPHISHRFALASPLFPSREGEGVYA